VLIATTVITIFVIIGTVLFTRKWYREMTGKNVKGIIPVKQNLKQGNLRRREIEVGWDSIGGYEDIKRELRDYIELPLRNKQLAERFGLKLPKGVLLFGPPGCGKTLFMKALAKETGFNFLYVNISDIMSKWYGESEQRLKELFNNARKGAPIILFFDEIDTIGTKREGHTGDSVTPRLLSLMLSEIDGLESDDGVIIVGSTNVPQLLDKALLRAGRFDKLIYVPPPNKQSREEILKIHCSKLPLEEGVDFSKIAELTERYSGADLANLCQEVARRVARESVNSNSFRKATMQDFLEIIKTYKPSISLQMLEEFEKFRLDFERRANSPAYQILEDDITLDDIGGYEKIKKELKEIVEIQLKYYKMMEELKITPIRGILLYGPPGVGKTMMAKAIAKSVGVKLIILSGAEIMYKGYEGAVIAIKEVFNRARENKPAIILVDELDAIAPRRGGKTGHEASKVVNQLLTEMDGIRTLRQVMVIATTNRVREIDPALLRPGRFDKIFYMSLPNKEERKEIIAKHLGDNAKDVDLDKISEITEGLTGADLAAISREAKIGVLKAKIAGEDRKLSTEDLILAYNKLMDSKKQYQKKMVNKLKKSN